jgi:hypothetical protein
VHLVEFSHGAFVNPLQRGHLTPYYDHRPPHVQDIVIRQAGTGAEQPPLSLHGRIKICADAFDFPSIPVQGEWAGMPVSPALVKWRLERWDGRIAIPETIAADFRTRLPDPQLFWSVYARGTYQNMAIFGRRLAARQPGRYLFDLTPKGLDTRHLRYGDDTYEIVVTAVDMRGNTSTLRERITVRNVRRHS